MKKSREMQYRNDGIAFALKIAKESGIEGLEKEAKFRNATMLPSHIDRKAVDDFVQETKENCLETVLLMAMAVLRDEFDFGQKRLERFKERFSKKSRCMENGLINWKDIQEQLAEETKVKSEFRNPEAIREIDEKG